MDYRIGEIHMNNLRPEVQLKLYKELHGFIKSVRVLTENELEKLEVQRFAGKISFDEFKERMKTVTDGSYASIVAYVDAMEGSEKDGSR